MPSCKRSPQRIVPDPTLSQNHRFHFSRQRIGRIRINQFEGSRMQLCHIVPDLLFTILSVKSYHRYVNHFIQIISKLTFDSFHRLASFHYHQTGSSGFLEYSVYLVKHRIRLIQVKHNLTFACQQCLFQCWNSMSCQISILIFQFQLLDFCQCIIFNQSFTIGCPVYTVIVHQY